MRTLLQDALAACTLYPIEDGLGVGGGSVAGSLFLFRASGGIRIQGEVSGLLPAEYRVVVRPYGQSSSGAEDVVLAGLDASLSLEELYANKAQDLSYRTRRVYVTQAPPSETLSSPDSSRLGASLLLLLPSPSGNTTVAGCELGLSRPPAVAQVNSAVPRKELAAFCTLRPVAHSLFPQLKGYVFFDAGESDSQVHVTANLNPKP